MIIKLPGIIEAKGESACCYNISIQNFYIINYRPICLLHRELERVINYNNYAYIGLILLLLIIKLIANRERVVIKFWY